MGELTVASVMTTRVVTVEPETPLQELVSKITEVRVRALPVVDRHGQPIGVVSRAELLPRQRVPSSQGSQGRCAADLMTTPVRAIHADEPVSFAAQLFAKGRFRRLFVVNWDSRLVGVVARRDLLRAYPLGDDELRTQLADLGYLDDVIAVGAESAMVRRIIAARPERTWSATARRSARLTSPAV